MQSGFIELEYFVALKWWFGISIKRIMRKIICIVPVQQIKQQWDI